MNTITWLSIHSGVQSDQYVSNPMCGLLFEFKRILLNLSLMLHSDTKNALCLWLHTRKIWSPQVLDKFLQITRFSWWLHEDKIPPRLKINFSLCDWDIINKLILSRTMMDSLTTSPLPPTSPRFHSKWLDRTNCCFPMLHSQGKKQYSETCLVSVLKSLLQDNALLLMMNQKCLTKC